MAEAADGERTPATPRAQFAWCLYDWASQGFPTVIATFVFAAYFVQGVADDGISGSRDWAYAMAASALFVAVTGPVLGAIADKRGRRKPWLAIFTVVGIAASALLWFVEPDPAFAVAALVLVAVGNIAFETGTIFYNAMLPDLVPKSRIGRLSGWGWGLGYVGGVACLAIGLFVFVQPEPAMFGLNRSSAEHVRILALLVAVWFAVFSVPFFLVTPDVPATGLSLSEAVLQGIGTLIGTLRRIREYRSIARFLIARMIYTDGLNTLFAVGGIYAAKTIGMDEGEVMVFGIAITAVAGVGAFAFGWVDDWIGPKRTIIVSVLGITALGVAILLVRSEPWFWALALPIGAFLGPAQAASRSFMARIAPPHLRNEMFGLYAFSGKATAWLGLFVFGTFTELFGSQRAGMATILPFLLIGLFLLLPLRDPKPAAAQK